MWNIVFYNDDYTSIEFVVFILTRVFHKSTEDALALTFAVRQGRNPPALILVNFTPSSRLGRLRRCGI
jgi:hypothetical protein